MKEKWEIKKLGEVGDVITGSTPKTSDYRNYNSNDYCFVKPSDFNNSIKEIYNSEYFISEFAYDNSRKLPINSVLVTCIGNIGNIAINKVECTTNQQINSIIPKNGIESKFLAYSIFAKKGYLQFIANAPVVPILNKTNFSNVEIPIPPLPVQQSIVAELDTLHRLKELQEQQLAELDNLAQSTFYHLFGDPIENEKGWEVRNLIDIVHLQRGHDLPIANRKNGIIPVYGSNGIVGYHNEMKKENGIITGRSGTIGKVIYSKSPFWPLNTTLYSINTHGNNIIYLTFLLNEFKLDRFYNGTGVPTLNRNVIHKEKVINPPLSIQNHFAERIEKIEAQKELVKRSIAETQTLIDYTMDKYFG